MPVFRAKHKATLAGVNHCADAFGAVPAFALVLLN